ncbi:uncharacterized protein PAC_13058 [Phialocephala subalpina]|uniref:Peptidase A1 domain-containing protein n=1 Tax=Phialocephala subalpina TaxID=576137 RepID=A0A1L7XDR1_9HELO|nr:uncharacterized protein PAC_13058 [Phialocephala subalpina]
MSSVSRWLGIGGAFAFLIRCTTAANTTPGALSVVPSLNWYGSDGDWSAISLRVGTPQVWTDVMVSTVSSENWIVGTGACAANALTVRADSLCKQSRGGGLFNPYNSSTWHNEGLYQFMVDSQLGNNGYGWYGLDNLTLGSTGITVSQTVIGQFNGSGPLTGTQYMLGMFGLGVTTAQFGADSPLPLINALVEVNGVIPSHSYGFTAGAKYQQKGELLSLTLGGYDANRFVPHNTNFSLNPDNNPQASIDTIFVQSGATSNNFTVPKQLLQPSDRVNAIIDSSTPYLWLPTAVCDRFASALGLSYNDTLNLYTYDANATQHDALANSQLSFTFSLSDLSTSPAVVNITLPFQAFDLQLTYPAIPNSTYGSPDATKNYFPLRRATDESQYTIGRAFLQEAYIITDYERNIFSVHQAVHVANPLGNTSIVSILQPSDSKFTSVGGSSPDSGSAPLHRGTIIAIAVSSSVFVVLVSFLALFLCRRRRQKKAREANEEKPHQTQHPQSFLARMLRRAPIPAVHEAGGESAYPTEVAADASHERFELPAPLGPAELDSEAGTTFDGTTEHGSSTQDSANLSSYERARRKLERTQIAAAQAQAQIAAETYPVEKNDADMSQVAHYRALDTPSSEEGLVSPIAPEPGNGWGMLNISHGSSEPSPVSPGFQSAPVSPTGPPPTYRRLPLNPANVVYAGRLPDNVRLPAVVPRIVGPDGRTIQHEPTMTSVGEEEGEGTSSSLGSQFTVEEQVDGLYGSGNTNVVSPNPSNGSGSSDPTSPVSRSSGSGHSREPIVGSGIERQSSIPENHATNTLDLWSRRRRRLHGEDLVHVPQPAENRFSWEEDRISGNEHEEGSL